MKALILITLFAVMSWGKVSNFNDLIKEDTQAQKELHGKVKNQVYTENEQEARQLIENKKNKRNAVLVVDDSLNSYNSPSNDRVFRYNKELKQKSSNPRKNQHRVAKEIKELEVQ